MTTRRHDNFNFLHFRYMSTVRPPFLLETLALTLDTTVTLFFLHFRYMSTV